MTQFLTTRGPVTALFLAALSCNLYAVDGVVLIDQNRALAGGVTSGDTPGFPITINQPGSYRLAGNLTVPLNVNGIQISANDITLDLNGFKIECSSSAVENYCIGETGFFQNISIRNGVVRGTAPGGGALHSVSGLYFIGSSQMTVEELQIAVNGGTYSLATGPFSIVRHNNLSGAGINGQCPTLYAENINNSGGAGGGGSGCVRVNNIGVFPTL